MVWRLFNKIKEGPASTAGKSGGDANNDTLWPLSLARWGARNIGKTPKR